MKALILLSLASLFTASALGATKSPHHKGKVSSINVGIRYSSLLENRGLILYDDFQVDPVLAAFFFDDRVEFLGDSLGFRDFIIEDRLRLRTRLVSITDQPLFPEKKSIRARSPQRDDTYEWSTRFEFFLPGYNDSYTAEFDLGYAKDLSAHEGHYIDLQSKIKLFDFRIKKTNTKIEPNLFTSIGWGDSNHNEYWYGPSSHQSGLNNISYGLWLAFPEEADRFYPIIQLRRFEALGDFKNSEFATGRNSGWLFSFIATYGVLE